MKVYCEYLNNPVGIDREHPRFSWVVDEDISKQKAYRVVVRREESGQIVWDSGVVDSDETLNIPYNGLRLETAQTYQYTVEIFCSSGAVIKKEDNTFTMGIMEQPVWRAAWIGGPWMEVQAFWFRTSFEIKKPVRTAFVYVISPNYYVLSVNGHRCGDAVLQNANTDPAKTLLYAAYPVEASLLQGENVIGIELGNGWKALSLGQTDAGVGEHMFSLQLRIEYTDGTYEWIYSDPDNWSYTKKGPVHENSIYHGEFYDAQDELPGWDMPGFSMEESGAEWFDAVEFEPEEGEVRAQCLEPIRVVKTMKPAKIYEIADGSYTFDMGQNFAGWARLRVCGERGTKIRLVYSELEYADHTVNQISLRHVRATDTYVLRGEGIEEYEPRFTFHGFRYVQVFGLPQKPDEYTLTGCVVRSDVERIGQFSCDNALLNQFQSNICWTEESNLHSIPTDCPQRDERLGWTNDMTVRNECALYNYRLASLYTKWLGDIRDTQGKKTGAITDTAPFRVFGCRPADPVGASLVLLPWNMYLHYRDVRILEENYDAIKRFLRYLEKNTTDYIMRWATMGDWAAPIGDNDVNSIGGGAVSLVTPPRMVATAFFYYECTLMEKIASVLGKKEDVDYYKDLSDKVKEAFLKTYYNRAGKYVGLNSQGGNTIALYFGLIPEEDRHYVMENLVKDIVETRNYHLTTGNLCSRYIIEVLLTNGYRDVAYKLLTQTTYPSWGYMIEKGATTVWERWEEIVSEDSCLSKMASYNHPMYGAVGVCFYKYFAGILADEEQPGFKNVIIRPVIPEALKHVEACVDTMRGRVANTWFVGEHSFKMKTQLPFNTTARIYIPKANANTVYTNIKVNGRDIYEKGTVVDGNCREEEYYIVLFAEAGTYVIECN
ncbi:alpha-L-rhamnosidase [Parablautia sp. Marseille-Q6255]|uniref:alpha-L-rhamnosidase n=1 Tax=Parablautia sp. Marseille-Q6255 TaxID=3039593 RepID=UPI0024BC4257|nr:alpha-L-rhamnosidase [Parablautia sp. Marseille-Q6255]